MSEFFILLYCREPGEPWVADFDVTFKTGVEASSLAKRRNALNEARGFKLRYRVRKVVETDNDNYISREAAKNHTPCPWEHSSYVKGRDYMFPHMDPDKPFQVRFFRYVEDAVSCKYTTMGVQKFLGDYEDLTEDERFPILVKIGFYTDSYTFGVTQDAELIQTIYRTGPTSCMNDPDEYELPDPHPSIVYSKGDLALAYLKDGERFTARGVVWPEKKLFYSTYGNSKLLKTHLIENGYSEVGYSKGGFKGARIGAFKDNDTGEWLMPYIDAAGYAKLDEAEEFFTLSSEGPWLVQGTTGYAEDDSYNYVPEED
jgi:hypothetical protein